MDKPFALILDDDRDTVALFRHVLDMAGYHTEIIMHGKVAAERLVYARPDVVLLDLNLPGVSGTEILHMIRSREHLKKTQVIVITGYSHIAQNLEENAELVLTKPVNIEQLSALVQRLQPTAKSLNESPIDEVTDLYNLSFFRSRLEYSLARLKQLNLSHFTVLLMDLAKFEDVENQLGVQDSRSMLREIAQLLKGTLRPTDTIAHLEGAQFAILVENIGHWDIPIVLANRIMEKVGWYLKKKQVQSYPDIGIILCHVGYLDVDTILQDARASLSLAKADGKPGYKFFAQDNFNNTYDLEVIADMISLVGGEQVRGQSTVRKTGIQVRPIRSHQTTPQFVGATGQ